jgi:hypothetical protein
MGGYVPSEYSLYYDIFRNAAVYGQNCDVYVCKLPENRKSPSAAEAAKAPPR